MAHHLSFEVVSAELKRTTKTTGKMDVYALVTMGSKNFETKIHKGGDRNPLWKQKFEYTMGKETSFGVEVWENDAGKHVLLASGKQDLSDISRNSNRPVWVSVFYQKKIVGKVLLQLTWREVIKEEPKKKAKPPVTEVRNDGFQDSGIQVSIIDSDMVRKIEADQKYREQNRVDKAVQANFWEIWETDYRTSTELPRLTEAEERCCSRCRSLPRQRKSSESYLNVKARGLVPQYNLRDVRQKSSLYMQPFDKQETTFERKPFRVKRYEPDMSRDKDGISRFGNMIMKNSFVTYDFYKVT